MSKKNVLLFCEMQTQTVISLLQALKGIPRNAYYIATKVARYERDPRKMFDFSREKTLQSVDHSLQLLGLDYVDIIQVSHILPQLHYRKL
jgi:aryl-alcohol dehydrogenase-like predicted oxidoreductase